MFNVMVGSGYGRRLNRRAQITRRAFRASMKIGFIGSAPWGPDGLHLQQAGYERFVWLRRPDATIDFPATRCISPCEVGQRSASSVPHGDIER